MKKLFFLLTILLTVSVSGNAQLVKFWNFPQGPTGQSDDFAADATNWSTSTDYYANTVSYKPNGVELYVNNKKIAITEDLKFTANATGGIRLYKKTGYGNYIMLNGVNRAVIIPGLKKGQIIELDCRTSNTDKSRTFTLSSNLKALDESFKASKERLINRAVVTEDGDAVLTTKADDESGGGMNIYYIAVFEAEPIHPQTWDFTKISETDLTNLADAVTEDNAKWKEDNPTGYIRYTTTVKYDSDNAALLANGEELDYTKGLKFTFPAKDQRISVYPNNIQAGLQLRATGVTLTIPELKKGTKIIMAIRSNGQGTSSTLTSENFTKDENATLTTATFNYTTGVATNNGDVSFTTESGGMIFRRITIIPPTVTFRTTGYATYSDDKNIDMSITDTNMKAYYAKSYSLNSVALSETTQFAANEGVILKGTPSEPYFLYEALEDVDVDGENLMKPNLTDTELSQIEGAYTNFILVRDGETNNVLFGKVDGTSTLAANRAYLQLPTASLPGARELSITFDDSETTSISEELKVKSEECNATLSGREFAPAAAMYDLQGRRVAQPTKGLYIVNGKKYIVK